MLTAGSAHRPDDGARAKHGLVHIVRMYLGRHKDAFSCMALLTCACVQRGSVKLSLHDAVGQLDLSVL